MTGGFKNQLRGHSKYLELLSTRSEHRNAPFHIGLGKCARCFVFGESAHDMCPFDGLSSCIPSRFPNLVSVCVNSMEEDERKWYTYKPRYTPGFNPCNTAQYASSSESTWLKFV